LRGRLAALLTLVTAREMNLAYEWSVREGAARPSGLEAAVIEVIRSDGPVEGLSRGDALLIEFGRQLFRNRHVQSATFAGAATGVNLARDIEQGWFDRLYVSPLSRGALLAGHVFSASLRALMPITVVVAIAVIFGVSIQGPDALLLAVLLAASFALSPGMAVDRLRRQARSRRRPSAPST